MNQFSIHKSLALEQSDETYRAVSRNKPCFWKGKYLLSSSRRSMTLVNGFNLPLPAKFSVLVTSRFCFFITSFTSTLKVSWITSVTPTNNAELFSIATPVPCQQCEKKLSSTRNLRRHEQKVDKIRPRLPPQTVCDECLESFESLSEAREYVELVLDMTSNSNCIYCHIIFLTAKAMNNICWRSTHCQFGTALRRRLPLPHRKTRSEANCVDTISKFVKKKRICFKSWCKTRRK